MANCGWSGVVLRRGRASLLCALLVLGGAVLFRQDAFHARPTHPQTSAITSNSLLARLPLGFEPNLGQAAEPVKFVARGHGYGLYLTPAEAVLTLARNDSPKIAMQFVGAKAANLTALESLPGHTNYFLGNDPSRWLRNVPQFERVRYNELYSGINLDFYGHEGRLEYDFAVAPGADPRKIELQFEGADARVGENGDLILSSSGRELRFQAPYIYQKMGSRQETVPGNFILLANGHASFEIGTYDRSRELVIDPVLAFSTYLGGTGDESCSAVVGKIVPHCPALAVDSASRLYVAGATTSTSGWPAPGSGPATVGSGGSSDVFVARISNTGSGLSLDFLTFLGGSGADYPAGIGVDSGFNVYVAGSTGSPDFPTINGVQSSATGNHAFVTKLDPSGSANLYSTYLGGSGTDIAADVALDSQAHLYVLGTTTSSDFPVTPGALQGTYPSGVGNQFFFAKLDPAQNGANSLLYATYFGGASAGGAMSGGAISVDSSLNVDLAGGTTFTDIPVVNAYQSALKGGIDIWAAKLKAPAANTQQYSRLYETYLGGTGDDIAYGASSDGTNMFVTGSTTSTDFVLPTGITAFQATNGGGSDAFVAKLGAPTVTGTTQGTVPLNYFTYLGGAGNDAGLSITADTTQNVRLTGYTTGGFPNINGLPGVSGGGTDAFFARIVTATGSTSSTTLLGGSGSDIGTSLVTDVTLNSYIAGETSSGDFPVASSSGQPPITPVQGSRSGNTDAFVSKLGPTITGLSLICPVGQTFNGVQITNCNPSAVNVNPSAAAVGNQVTYTFPIYNTGDPVNGGVFTATLFGATGSLNSASATGGTSNSGSGSGNCNTVSSTNVATIVCNLGTLNTSTATTSSSVTTLSSSGTVTVKATATAPTTPLAATAAMGVTGVLNITGTTFQSTIGTQGQINDFTVQASPASQTVTAGNQATYTVTVTPTGAIPESVSLGSCTGLPAGAACSFSGNPIPNLNNLAQSRTMNITTTPRVTTPASLNPARSIFYAFWLPVSGLAFVGMGATRRRRWLLGVFVACTLAFVVLQAGCSSYSSNNSNTTGTPAGTYTVTMNATSGSAIRSTSVTLVVK